jgi:hypothetical protein
MPQMCEYRHNPDPAASLAHTQNVEKLVVWLLHESFESKKRVGQ